MTEVNLREQRINRGYSVRQMADEIGISPSVLQRAEAGESIHPKNAHAIASFYGYKVTQVWPLDEEPAAA